MLLGHQVVSLAAMSASWLSLSPSCGHWSRQSQVSLSPFCCMRGGDLNDSLMPSPPAHSKASSLLHAVSCTGCLPSSRMPRPSWLQMLGRGQPVLTRSPAGRCCLQPAPKDACGPQAHTCPAPAPCRCWVKHCRASLATNWCHRREFYRALHSCQSIP